MCGSPPPLQAFSCPELLIVNRMRCFALFDGNLPVLAAASGRFASPLNSAQQ